MAKLRVFLEIEFLKSYFNELRKELGVVEFPEKVLFVKEILKNCDLYVNLDKEAIAELMFAGKADKIDKNDISFFLKAHCLRTSSVLRTCLAELTLLKEQNYHETMNRPHYILLGQAWTYAQNYSEQTGVVFIPNDFEFPNGYSEVINESIQPKINLNFSDYTAGLVRSNSLIIDDPYLYTVNPADVKLLLSNLIFGDGIINKVFLIIYKDPIEENSQKNWIKEIKKMNNKYINVEILQVEILQNNIKIHDRHIISNTFWITCGLGFKPRYNSQTFWFYFPIGKYYSRVVDRIEFLLKFINDPDISHEIKECFAIEN